MKTTNTVPSAHHTLVTVRATEAHRNDDGTFTLVIPSRPLTEEEQALMVRMFPHTMEQAYELLHREVLIGSIVKPTDL